MRIALSAGHNVYIGKYFDCGAVGSGKREAAITKATVKKLIPLLEAQEHRVKDVTPYNQSFSSNKAHHEVRCKAADDFGADIFLDVHINSGGGTGVECLIYSKGSPSYKYADRICKNISKNIGLRNRGVKVNPALWSVSLCKTPAIILEGAFIDDVEDMSKLNPSNYAREIARAFGEVSDETISPKPKYDNLYRVRKSWNDSKSQIGAFKNLNNAKRLADKNKGYSVYDSKGNKIYPKKSSKRQSILTWRKYISGQEVKNLQRELNRQFNRNLKVDGYFGDRTINALVTVRRNAKGNLTKIIQRRLLARGYDIGRSGADGIFGGSTEKAIQQLQRDNGLQVDGIVGKETWKQLFRK